MAGDAPRRRFLQDAEINYLRYGLRLEASVSIQKRALQTLCEHYEAGRLVADPADLRHMIITHLSSPDVLVRRWAIKALALIGNPDDFSRIVDRLKVEEDAEAKTWGVTGLVKNARDRSLKEICELAGLPNTSSIILAARLYAPNEWISTNAEDVRISIDSDELTLKWATFLIGYGRAPEDLFHPKFSNDIFLGELNAHPDEYVSEYSIWALWERPEFGAAHSKIALEDVRRHPESVRKWCYRLATQSADIVGFDPTALSDLRRDRSERAREGLALGVVDLNPRTFSSEVLEWYTAESSSTVRESLLASMASRSQESPEYADIVEWQFGKQPPDSPLRRRLLAASQGSALYGQLKTVAFAEEKALQGLLIPEQSMLVQINAQGDVNMGPTIKAGRDVVGQNIAMGHMINSANSAIQQLEKSDEGTAEILREVMSMLSASPVEEGKQQVVAAVQELASSPSAEAKKTLIERVKGFGAYAAAAGSAIAGLDGLVQAIGGIVV